MITIDFHHQFIGTVANLKLYKVEIKFNKS